jgi:hypothetical protein
VVTATDPNHDNSSCSVRASASSTATAWPLLLAALLAVLLASEANAHTVENNAALEALSTFQYASVTRLGFSVAGDGGRAVYRASSSACPLAGGNGDGGSQVKSADSKCWLADFAATQNLPQIYGAGGKGTTDDTTAVTAWLVSGNLLVCAGVYRLTEAVSVAVPANAGLLIQGDTRNGCKFLQSGTRAGVSISGSAPDFYSTSQIVLRDFSVAPDTQMTVPALSITVPTTVGDGWTDPGPVLDNVSIKPTKAGNYAPTCVLLTNVGLSKVSHINCEGDRNGYRARSIGISFVGGTNIPTETYFDHVHVFFMDTGMAVSGQWQGISIAHSMMVGVRVGVSATGSDNNELLLRFTDGVLDAQDYGIRAANIANVQVSGNLIYLRQWGTSTATNPAGVSIMMSSTATAYPDIHNNAFQNFLANAKTWYGIFIDGPSGGGNTTAGLIANNSFLSYTFGIGLGAHSVGVQIGPNRYDGMVTANVQNNGTGNTIVASADLGPGNQTGSQVVDYATGTWTPVLAGLSTPGTFTPTIQIGSYERNGRTIIARFTVAGTLDSAAGSMTITGLPFTSANTINDFGLCPIELVSGWTADTNFTALHGIVNIDSGTIFLYEGGPGQTAQQPAVGKFGTVELRGMCNYHN